MTIDTAHWWWFLCTLGALNVLAWLVSAAVLLRRRGSFAPLTWAAMRLQLLLSAGYVLGCAFRSVFPVYDIGRLCLVDSWLSSAAVGRSVATVAELCFAAQWALLLRGVAQTSGSAVVFAVSRIVVPLIVLAELCSWYAVLTTANLGHVFEESIWALCAALLVASVGLVWPRCRRRLRPLLATVCVLGLAYVVYMFEVDIPMYWTRWSADLGSGRHFLSLAQGLADASGRWIVSHRWNDWRTEVAWMSLYFSVAVWASIGLAHVPALGLAGPARGDAGRRGWVLV